MQIIATEHSILHSVNKAAEKVRFKRELEDFFYWSEFNLNGEVHVVSEGENSEHIERAMAYFEEVLEWAMGFTQYSDVEGFLKQELENYLFGVQTAEQIAAKIQNSVMIKLAE